MNRRNLIGATLVGTLLLGAGALLPARGLSSSPASAESGSTAQLGLEELEAATAADPRDDVLAAELGLAYLDQVRSDADPRFYPKAETAFRAALDINPRNFQATFGMAALAAGRHDFHGALRWSRKGIALDPHNSDVRGVQGDALIELGRFGEARAALQKMVDLKPGLPAFARISYLHELHGDVLASRREMRAAFESAGSLGDAAFAASHIGDLHLNEQQIEKAETWYLRGSELDPSATQPLAGLAKIAAARGNIESAIDWIVRLLEINEEPGNAFFLGDLYRAAGNTEAAQDAYALGLQLNDRETANGSNVRLEASLFAADKGDPKQALRLARAEYRSRRSIHVADAYAWSLYANGRYREAQRLSERALTLGTRKALFHFHAGMIALQLEQRSKALRHLTTALSLDPVFSLEHRATAERIVSCLRSNCGSDHR